MSWTLDFMQNCIRQMTGMTSLASRLASDCFHIRSHQTLRRLKVGANFWRHKFWNPFRARLGKKRKEQPEAKHIDKLVYIYLRSCALIGIILIGKHWVRLIIQNPVKEFIFTLVNGNLETCRTASLWCLNARRFNGRNGGEENELFMLQNLKCSNENSIW